MINTLKYLEINSEHDFDEDPLYAWIESEPLKDPREKLKAFIPILSFILTFSYYNSIFLKYAGFQSEDDSLMELADEINMHADEDATHIHFLINDIASLDLAKVWGLTKPSDLLWAIWSSPTLDKAYRISSDRIRSLLRPSDQIPTFKFLHIEQIEKDGNYLFSASKVAADRIQNQLGLTSIYFGKYHLDRELGHVSGDACRRINLTCEQSKLAKKLIHEKHNLSLEMNKVMHEFALSYHPDASSESSMTTEKKKHIKKVQEKVELHQKGDIPDMSWQISPEQQSCDPLLYSAWKTKQEEFINHPLSEILSNANEDNCEQILRTTMLLFANRMLSLRIFNLYDLNLSEESDGKGNEEFARVRKMYSTHASLFFHDWNILGMDDQIALEPSEFLKLYFVDSKYAKDEMVAIHEFKREALNTVTCQATQLWCYLSINFMASAFTLATKKAASLYAKKHPNKPPLVYMQGLLHLLYEEVDPNWNHLKVPSDLYRDDITPQKRRDILNMMDKFSQYGIKQWDHAVDLISDEDRSSKIFHSETPISE